MVGAEVIVGIIAAILGLPPAFVILWRCLRKRQNCEPFAQRSYPSFTRIANASVERVDSAVMITPASAASSLDL